jgi:hypothetical protein
MAQRGIDFLRLVGGLAAGFQRHDLLLQRGQPPAAAQLVHAQVAQHREQPGLGAFAWRKLAVGGAQISVLDQVFGVRGISQPAARQRNHPPAQRGIVGDGMGRGARRWGGHGREAVTFRVAGSSYRGLHHRSPSA